MTETKLYFLELLSSYINQRQPKLLPDDVNPEEIINLAKIHNVNGILYVVCGKNQAYFSADNMSKLKKAFLRTVALSIKQDNALKPLIHLLTENKIPHLLTKGALIKRLYPDKDLRTMSDIDILVKNKDAEKAINILTDNGYNVIGSHLKEVSFEKNGVHIEIHTSLMDENPETGFDYIKYYSNVFDRAVQMKDYTYKLNVNDHFIYLLVHIAKHFYNEGCGIRMIMDIAVYCNKLNSEINWQYVLKELEKIKLKRLAFNIFYLCKKYFDTQFEFDIPPMSDELYESITDYIMSGGTYGFYRENAGNKSVRKYRGIKMLKYVFPNVSEMRELCFWFRNKPSILLPIAWIIRINEAFAAGKGKSMRESKKQNVNEDIKLLRELGIYE